MDKLSSFNRDKLIQDLSSTDYDLLIIGGGITGAGIALDAASRGLKTALVEKNDFASGTSSRSTKLIHGGLRYLKQFEIMLVREVGRERAIVHSLAPHLVNSERMLLPLIKGGSFGKITTSLGLMIYDVLAGVEEADQRKILSKEETMQIEPLLKEDVVEGGGIYAEYRTDDARLTIEVIKTAASFGADSINYVKAEGLIYDDGHISGLKCQDLISGRQIDIHSKFVVSAAGPWVDKVRDKDQSLKGKHLHLTKGVHLVVPHERLPVKQAVYFDVPDGRMIFSIPRGNITYIGTTDTDFHGDIDSVKTTKEDAWYLLDAVNNTFPTVNLTLEDVVSSWAGLRPLIYEEGKSASELSRKDEIFISDSGLISIAGGKLTGYRKMAERLVDKISKKHQKKYGSSLKECFTDKIIFTGGPFKGSKEVKKYTNEVSERISKFRLDFTDAEYLVSNYGKQSELILEKMNDFLNHDPVIALARAELWYTVHHEMVLEPLDFIMRRTGRLYFNIDSIEKILDPVLNDFKYYFDWNTEKVKRAKSVVGKATYEAANFK